MRSSPWLHQKRSESAPPVSRPRDPPSISIKEQDDITERISRPTESALYRQSLYWKMDSFMERGFHSWSKMNLFEDCKRCMWTPQGTIKSTCKIRPHKKIGVSLPPLDSGRTSLCESGRGGIETSRSVQDSHSTPSTQQRNGRSGCRGSRGSSSRSLVGDVAPSNHRSVLANGLSALGGMNGARYRLHNNPSKIATNGSSSKIGQYVATVHSMAVPRVAGTGTTPAMA